MKTDQRAEGPTELQVAFAKWTAARARLYALDSNPDVTEDAYQEEADAEWAIIRARTQGAGDLRLRAVVVGVMFSVVAEAGEPSDQRHMVALNRLLLDIAGPLNGDL